MSKTYRNRVFDTGSPVYWYSPTPDSSGDYYPGPSAFGATSDFCSKEVIQDEVVFSVRDFGAKGDGTTDDTTAFQNAITASGTGGYTIYIPPGDYLIDTELDITWTSPGAFTGAGPNATNLIINGDVTNFLDFDVSYAYVGNFSIWGSANTKSNSLFWANTISAAVKFTNFDFSTFENIEFIGATNKGIYAVNVESSKIGDLTFRRCGSSSLPNFDIDDGIFEYNKIYNINFIDAFSNTQPVFYSDNAYNCTFSDLKTNQATDVYVEVTLTGGPGFTNGENCTITGGITGKVRTYNTLSGASPVVVLYNLSALTFVTTDTLTGLSSSSTATIDDIRWCRGIHFSWADSGEHTIDNIECFNGDNNATGNEAIFFDCDCSTINNVSIMGDFPQGGIVSSMSYSNLNGITAYASGNGSVTAKLLDVSGSDVSITNVVSSLWGEVEFDASYSLLSNVSIESYGDVVALDVGGIFNRINNINIFSDGTATGAIVDFGCDYSILSNVVISEAMGASSGIYINSSSDGSIITSCSVSRIFIGSGIVCHGKKTVIENNYIYLSGIHGIHIPDGGTEIHPARICGNTIDRVDEDGGSTGCGIYLGAVQAASADNGLIVSDNKFIKGYASQVYDLYLDNVWQNVIISNNNATEGKGTSSLGTGTGKVIVGNKGITTSESLAGSSLALSTGAALMTGTGDPGSGAGTAATQGSVFMRTDGGTGTTFYVKDGAADTDWGAAGGGLVLSSIPATTTTVGAGEDNLTSVTLPQNSHSSYTMLKIEAAGTTTGTNDNKTIKFYYGASSVTVHPAVNRAGDWQFEAKIALKTATDARCKWNCFHESLTHGYNAFSDDLSAGDITLKFTGECDNAGDTVTQTMFIATLG